MTNAIGTRIKELYPEKRVLYVSAHLFQVQYTDSVRTNHFNDFISFYQTIDVLIIDDIQEFAGVTKTQNTFFHIFNHLHQNGKQLILTSDRAPVMLQGMEERLLTRFKWGLVAELEKPDVELRKNILRNKIRRDGLNIPETVINYIAENVNESVRELEGIINSLLAQSIIFKRDVDLDLAERIVRKAVRCCESKPVTVEDIIQKVCNHYEIEESAIHTKTRKREVVQVRQVAMYLAKKHTDSSSSKIGQLIGNKDHATVLHACKIVKDQVEVDKTFKADIEEIEASLKRNRNKTTEVRKGYFLISLCVTSVVLRLIVSGNSFFKALFLQGFFQSYRHAFIIRLLVSDLSKYLSQCFFMIFFNKLMIFRK